MAYNYEYPYVDPERHNDDWAINIIKNSLQSYSDRMDEINEDNKEIKEDLKKLEYIINNYDERVAEVVKQWIATMIFVEITSEGYIVYNIPESWKDITFNTTGLDVIVEMQPEYGYLVLSY